MATSKRLVQPMILAFILGTGFTLLWVGVAGGLISVATRNPNRDWQWQRFHVQADGAPVIQSALGFHDLAGNVVNVQDRRDALLTPVYLPNQPRYRSGAPWNQRVRSFLDDATPSILWYFVCDGTTPGSGYLVGYHSESYARVGFIGLNGFRADEPPEPDRFPFDGAGGINDAYSGLFTRVLSPQNPYGSVGIYGGSLAGPFDPNSIYVQATDKVYHIDIHRRAVSVIVENQSIRSMQWIHDPGDYQKLTGLAIRTDKGVLVFDRPGAAARTFQLPAELRDRLIAWNELGNGAVAWTDSQNLLREQTIHHLFWLDADGRITRQQEVTLAGQDTTSFRVLMGGMFPAPAFVGACIFLFVPMEGINDARVSTWPEAWSEALAAFWPSLVLAAVIAAVLAGLCYRRELRYGASLKERMLWSLFVFAFGVGGWVGYRFARSWPTPITCPSCGAPVPCDRPACAVCQAEFSQPALKGTEVFA